MSDKRIKALAIKVHPKTEPNGVEFVWDKIPQLEVFTKNILIPEIAVDQDGNSAVNIGTIVSGIPSVFARANLFKNAIDNIRDKDAEASGLMLFYKSLISEWKGLISCIALNYKDIEANRIHLSYSDGRHLNATANIYEPTGAFGNMLFERKPLWCDQSLANNADRIPFIDVISFKGNVIGGTSPDSFVFTSVSYQIKEKFPFINVQNGKFIDPLQSEINPQELSTLYGYAKHILENIEKFRLNYAGVEELIRPEYGNISTCIQAWMNDMVIYQQAKGYPKLDKSTSPEVGSLFNYPFGLLFNYSTELYGSEGIIYNELKEGSILFDPKDLLLPDTTEIAQIDFGREGMETRNFLKSKPILLLAAETKGQLNSYAYFTLPLTPLALNVFGATLDALVGISESSNVKSRITAIYDPADKDGERLIVQLKLYTETGNEIVKEVIYRVTSESISGKDILMWPNFISKQWNRYFLYSEIPHNDAKFQATPFIGNVDDDFFRIVLDEKGIPLYLANNGKAAVISEKYGNIKAQLHIASNNAVADNKYKYEIYESNKPFKGVKFAHAGVDCGFGIIRYDGSGNTQALPVNMLNAPRTLSPAFLGVDFGSTNSSIAYFSDQRNEVCENLKLTNKRVSLLATDSKNNDERPAVEDEIFFFQNDEILTNSIKSVLTIHDSRRVVNDGNIQVNSLMAQAVKGGFPCFEKNLPIENAENNRYILGYNRIGRAELVYNMKWSTQQIDKSYKTAYLSTLLLHVYAQLFIEGHEPHTLKWSYPSSMGKELLSEYRGIWDSLKEISPIESNVKLKTFPPSDLSDIGDTSGNSSWGSPVAQSGGWGSQDSAPAATTSAWGSTDTGNSGWGEQAKTAVATGWGNEAKKTLTAVDIKTETGPVRFDFKKLSNEESLSEACAVANYLVRPNGGYSINPGELVLCFDIGGSTTDITALCQMEGGKAMIKQNSIRFAAERVAQATKFSPNFKNVLLRICEKKKISIQGLNSGTPKFNENTAPYYFEQVVDRLEASDFETFYLLIAAECKEMMSINLYVTGLIMFYAGQLAYKLRNEIVKSEDAPPAVKAIPPKIKIAFAGKGARIFDWFTAVNPAAADDYYTQMFIRGMGGEAVAKQTISPITTSPLKIIDINSQRGTDNADVKYEVSKGLAIPTNITSILVPTNKQAIEILGEDNFCVVTPNGEFKYLESTNSITPEMLEHIGNHFICLPQEGKPHCPRFMDFADLFYKVSSSMFGLKMNATDFMAGFQDMNIENYIKGEPDFIKAQKRKHDDQKDFDYVAPIIILEGMKFFEKHLLKGIQKTIVTMGFCVLAKISKRTVTFWYQADGNPYAPLKMRESNEIPLYFYVNGNDFVFGAAARERFYKNDPYAYGNYFEIVKDPAKHFSIYGNKKPVKQLFYYGFEQYLSHFLNTVLYKSDSIESYRQQFPLRFLFDDDIEDNEKSLIENLFQEAGYFNLDRIAYHNTLFNILAQKQILSNNKAILFMNGIDDVLYLNLYKNSKAEALGSAKLPGQGADPRVKILADMIVEYIILQNSYLSVNKDAEIAFLLPFSAALLQNISPIIKGEAELSDGNRYWFNVREKNLNDRLQYYTNDGMIFTAIDDLLRANSLQADGVMILLGSEEISTAYFSDKLLKRYHHVMALQPVDVKHTMLAIFQTIANAGYSVKAKVPNAPPVLPWPALPTPKMPPPLPPKKQSDVPKPVNIPRLPEIKVPQNTKNNPVKPPPLPPKKS